MTTNADILAALQRDVAAASPRPYHTSSSEDVAQVYGEGKLLAEYDQIYVRKSQGRANARIATLDGPALLEALIEIAETLRVPVLTAAAKLANEKPRNRELYEQLCKAEFVARAAIADAGKVLGL